MSNDTPTTVEHKHPPLGPLASISAHRARRGEAQAREAFDRYRFGDLRFTIKGTGRFADCVRQELASLPTRSTARPHIAFNFVPRLPELPGNTAATPLRVSEGACEVHWWRLHYQLRRAADRYTVDLERIISRRRPVPDQVRRFLDRSHAVPEEEAAKSFLYDLFDYLTQICLVELGGSYLHASSVAKAGRGVALIAWGGTGKTESLLGLVRHHGWKYLSDDLVLLDSRGRLVRSPKKIPMYAKALAGEPDLRRRVFAGRGPWDRLAWKFQTRRFGETDARRRVTPDALFGEAGIADSATLTKAIFLERADVPGFEELPIEADELAQRTATMLLREIDPYFQLASAVHTVHRRTAHGPTQPVLPDPVQLWRRTRGVLAKQFRTVDIALLRIPQHVTPADLTDRMRRMIEN